MAKHKVFINKDGNIRALCNNRLEYISDLGSKVITRAADVEFNNSTQVWEIITPEHEIIGTNPRRPEAIQLEIRLMEERLRSQLV
jgi:hypothetical protein